MAVALLIAGTRLMPTSWLQYQQSISDNMCVLAGSVQRRSGHPSIDLAEPPPKAFRNASYRGSRVSIGR